MSEKQGAPPSYEEAAIGHQNAAYSAPVMDDKGFAPPSYTPPQGQPAYQQNMGQQQSGWGQPTVFNTQPGTTVIRPPMITYATTTVPDHMNLAVFATFCCCWPIGMFAIMKVNESRAALARNDLHTAMINANEAKRLSNIAIACGSIFLLAAIVVMIVVFTTILPSYSY